VASLCLLQQLRHDDAVASIIQSLMLLLMISAVILVEIVADDQEHGPCLLVG
jgi:hypothetical protein